MKNKILIATGITALIVGGIWVKADVAAVGSGCVNTYVDFGKLSKEPPVSNCITINGEQTALKIFNLQGLKLTGSDKYGDQIVCLVNALPKKADCSDMPPENAYWAVLVKHSGVVSAWNWADKGVADLKLKAGDSVALSYTIDGKVRWPK